MTDQSSQPQTIGQLKKEEKKRYSFAHPVMTEEQRLVEPTSLQSPPSLYQLEGIPTLSQILAYPKRDKKCRLGKTDPSQPPVRGIEIVPGMDELPFTTSRIRVGGGGKFMVLHLINDENPFIVKNIKDGEWFELRACRILASDCQNIVIFD